MATRSISVHYCTHTTRRQKAGYGISSSTHYPIPLLRSFVDTMCSERLPGTVPLLLVRSYMYSNHLQQPCHCLSATRPKIQQQQQSFLPLYRTQDIKYYFLVPGRIRSYRIRSIGIVYQVGSEHRKAWYTAHTNNWRKNLQLRPVGKERQLGRSPPCSFCRPHHPWLLPKTETTV